MALFKMKRDGHRLVLLIFVIAFLDFMSTGPTRYLLSEDKNKNLVAFSKAVKEASRLLYKDSHDIHFWMNQSIPKVYFYENVVPDEWSNVELISKTIDARILEKMDDGTNLDHDVCRWYPKVCSDDKNTKIRRNGKAYSTQRYNFNADVTLLESFRKCPSRTDDPNEADLFIIPYPYISHSISYGTRPHYSEIEQNVVKNLPYFNETTQSRHVWVLGLDWVVVFTSQARDEMSKSISLSLGPVPCLPEDGSNNKASMTASCSKLVHPYPNTAEKYQPSVLRSQWWWNNNNNNDNNKRVYAMACAFGTPSNNLHRQKFYAEKHLLGNDIHGLPIRMIDMGEERHTKLLPDPSELYGKSLFCPILPGDTTVQKRFFDVMLNGCIPLVAVEGDLLVAHTTGTKSSLGESYPYSRDVQFYGDDKAGIDYIKDLIVTFDAECGAACARQAMIKMMENPAEIKRRQENIKQFAPLFSYGLDDDMFQSADAFAAIMVNMRHHLAVSK